MSLQSYSGLLLDSLQRRLADYLGREPDPLLVDKWIARSCLQKAIRRGEVNLAQRSLATLMHDDPCGIWRHLIVIGFEDVGAANFITVAQVIAASANRKWREEAGGSWKVASFLASELAAGPHCQATCDLLLRARYSSHLHRARAQIARAGTDEFTEMISSRSRPLEERALAVLALAGEFGARPDAALALVALQQPYSDALIGLCELGWRKTRDPMTLLFPLIWEHWLESSDAEAVLDDPFPPVTDAGLGVPGYALDQFTRVGNKVARMLLAARPELRRVLDEAGFPSRSHPRAVGDLLFLHEGGLVVRRLMWGLANDLRLPWRCLPATARLGEKTASYVARVQEFAEEIGYLRASALAEIGLPRSLST